MNSAIRVLLLFLWLVAKCNAYSKFKTDCTVPTDSVNFVSSPNSRGTLDILWSSLFTLVACTWTILHLNVPEQRDRERDKGLRSDVKWALKGFWTNFKWMIFTMLAPEFILGKAFGDLLNARRTQGLIEKLAQNDNVEWSLSHSFFADMGGFVGVSEDEPLDENGQVNKRKAQPLTAAEILWLRTTCRSGNELWRMRLERLPDITTAELLDKSKGDAFVKTLAAFQVLWVALQIVVRAAKGLAISQLELAVAAFSACAFVTYLLFLYKPHGIGVPTRPFTCQAGSIEVARGSRSATPFRGLFVPGFNFLSFHEKYPGQIPNDLVLNDDSSLGLILGCVIFGSIHVAGWNLTFPTEVEQLLWRYCSIFLVISSPVVFRVIVISASVDLFEIGRLFALVCAILYVMVRLFMLVEIFRTLPYLPPDVYISTWASLPHVA